MEKESSFETEETPEQHLALLLKEKGPADPEARKLLADWINEQEKQVEQIKNTDDDKYRLAQIHFNLRRARLYFEAGYPDEAHENLEDARTQAWNENRQEIYEEIMEEMDRQENFMKQQ